MKTFSAWVFLLSLGMPGPVMLWDCNNTHRIVGYSMHKMGEVRPTTISDIQFALDATAWERNRVGELLAWGEFCWSRHGCIVGDTYDPPPPPMKCPEGEPTS